MKPEDLKRRSKGVSVDMSPQAISARLDILVELHDTAKALGSAKWVGKADRQVPSGQRELGGDPHLSVPRPDIHA